jgi:hypothetical protein
MFPGHLLNQLAGGKVSILGETKQVTITVCSGGTKVNKKYKIIKTDTNRVTPDYVIRHLNFPREHNDLIELQTLLTLKPVITNLLDTRPETPASPRKSCCLI